MNEYEISLTQARLDAMNPSSNHMCIDESVLNRIAEAKSEEEVLMITAEQLRQSLKRSIGM